MHILADLILHISLLVKSCFTNKLFIHSFIYLLIFSKWVGWVCPWGMSSVPWKATWKQPSPQSDGGVLFLRVCIQLIKQTILSHLFSHLTCLVFFSPSGELVQIMMATANENLSAKFCNRVLKFFTKLFQLSKSNAMILIKNIKTWIML